MTHAWQPFNWYRDVAYYDLIFDQTTQEEVAFLEGIVERHGHGAPSGRAALHQDGAQRQLGARPGRAGRALPRVLEPGCGSGRLVAALAERGWSVTGFDIEPRALGFAKARVKGTARRRIALSLGRFDAFQAPRAHFDLAHCLYSTLLHATAPGEAERHLQRVCSALRVGGLYVIGLHLTEYDRTEPIRERADCRRRGLRVIYTLRHDLPDRATRLQPMRCRLSVRRAGSQSVRRLESRWNFRTYDERELRQLLCSEPRFRLVATHDFHHDLHSLNEGRHATFDRVLILKRTR